MAFNYSGFLADPAYFNAYSSIPYQTTTINFKKYVNQFANNIYRRNFASLGQGLIDLFGIVRVYFENEIYSDNGENVVEITEYYRKNLFSFSAVQSLYNSTFS
jgi:hypothetical protein